LNWSTIDDIAVNISSSFLLTKTWSFTNCFNELNPVYPYNIPSAGLWPFSNYIMRNNTSILFKSDICGNYKLKIVFNEIMLIETKSEVE